MLCRKVFINTHNTEEISCSLDNAHVLLSIYFKNVFSSLLDKMTFN